MALVVENGTGLSGAETYVALPEFQAYCAGRLYDLTGHAADAQEAALRKAADFVDTFGRYKGRKLSGAQALEFPREGLTDWGGLELLGVPALVKRATCELAWKALSEELLADLDRGGRIQSESVGPISVSYAPDAPAGKLFQLATKLLQPLLRLDGQDYLNGPGHVAPVGEIFALGQHDQPGSSDFEG